MVPGPLDVVHVQRLVMAADMLRHRLRCPCLVILFFWKAYVERLEPTTQARLSHTADQGGIDPTTEQSAKWNVAFHLSADGGHHERISPVHRLLQCHRGIRCNCPSMIGACFPTDPIGLQPGL